MNKYWPKNWKQALPNFLGEDFFSSFEDFEGMFEANNGGENNSDNTNTNDNDNNTNNNNVNKTIETTSSIKVNIYESSNEVLCIFRLPGLKLKEVEINIYGITLEVTGKIHVAETGFRPIHCEIYQGPVHRKVTLPVPVRQDKVEASYNHGYLIIRLHRLIRPEEKQKTITIHDLEKD